mmetsp:Transcript_14205/g.36295  ORF Transcript_14205/g.36295 Transcript_14205/m.36295 type:complete len:277 (-) Transcript_14205:923-1753(-)
MSSAACSNTCERPMMSSASTAVTNVAANPKIRPEASSSAEMDCSRVANPILGMVAKKKKMRLAAKTSRVPSSSWPRSSCRCAASGMRRVDTPDTRQHRKSTPYDAVLEGFHSLCMSTAPTTAPILPKLTMHAAHRLPLVKWLFPRMRTPNSAIIKTTMASSNDVSNARNTKRHRMRGLTRKIFSPPYTESSASFILAPTLWPAGCLSLGSVLRKRFGMLARYDTTEMRANRPSDTARLASRKALWYFSSKRSEMSLAASAMSGVSTIMEPSKKPWW